MSVPRPPTVAHHVEAAANRVMHLWSLIKLAREDQLKQFHSSLVEKLTEQQHLSEDELVIVGLKYLHQNAGSKKQR
jgi:hypothetical protein